MKLQLTASGVLGLAALGGVGFLIYKFKDVNLNPADSKNVINTAVTDAVGEKTMATIGDYYFAAIDLVNPLNKSDEYAESVYGIDKIKNLIGF